MHKGIGWHHLSVPDCMINEIISEIKDAEASFSVYLKNGPWERCAGVYFRKNVSEIHPKQ